MLKQKTCNLLTTIPRPPWIKPLNWNLHVTFDGEERIPFHLFVHTRAAATLLFPQFGKLPTELQFRILAFCSAPTLFQAMRVSSRLRTEAIKLFWADPNTYYLIESSWLLKGGHPADTYCELPFLDHVQNVEVEYQSGTDWTIAPSRDDDTASVLHVVLRSFWDTLRKRFPRVRRIIINHNLEPLPEYCDDNPVSRCLQGLVKSCPPGIDVSVFILEEEKSYVKNNTISSPTNKWQRSLYRLTQDGEWNKVIPGFYRKTILMPMKKLHGPAGEFMGPQYLSIRWSLQDHAVAPLVIEALDRYHFDKGRLEPFSCIEPGCDAYFEEAGQWTIHAIETHDTRLIKEKRFNKLPDELRIAFQNHERGLDRKGNEIGKTFSRLYAEWNEEGEERRNNLEERWINQLETDKAWDTGTKARESELWDRFTLWMSPTWCGQ
jgi:hypothetical protein